MIVTVVVRLVGEQLATGRFAGEVTDVIDGTRVAVRSLDDLVGFLRSRAGGPDDQQRPGGPRSRSGPDLRAGDL